LINFGFENLGKLKKGNININKLTIFCGENNTGKTYASYSIYGLLKNNFNYSQFLPEYLINELTENKIILLNLEDFINNNYEKLIEYISKEYSQKLSYVFNSDDKIFSKSSIKIFFDKEKILENIKNIQKTITFIDADNMTIEKPTDNFFIEIKMSTILNNENKANLIYIISKSIIIDFVFPFLYNAYGKTFFLPAERSGLSLFYKELNVYRESIIYDSKIKNNFSLKDKISNYPLAVSDYLVFLNQLDYLKKNKTKFTKICNHIEKNILNGSYEVENNNISFKVSENKKLDFHLTSSTVKTFFGLLFYIKHIAKEGSFLIIDEPELNLHPDNQRKVARILAQLVNVGVNVIISTHSDYIIREFNNLIMLNNKFPEQKELLKKYNYEKSELLNINDVNAYLFKDDTVELMEIDSKEGIIAKTFDDVINNLNKSSNDIYYTLNE